MTLCLAWKQNQNIYFASDSRLTSSDRSTLTDDAPKIFKIGVEIYSSIPTEVSRLPEKLEHQTTYGLCFAGSYLNGSTLADTIDEVLSNIQVTPHSDFSIDILSDLAFAIYKQVSRQLIEINRDSGSSEVLFGGYCLINKSFKIYKFSYERSELVPITFNKEEIIFNGQTILLGDPIAKQKAEELLKKVNQGYSRFHVLRDVIRDNSIPTVGGYIQSGIFKPSKFKTYGILEFSSNEDEYGFPQVQENWRFRGLSLDFEDNELTKGRLNIHKSFLNPFDAERIHLIDKSIEDMNHKIKKTNR